MPPNFAAAGIGRGVVAMMELVSGAWFPMAQFPAGGVVTAGVGAWYAAPFKVRT
jgi:hypothetical protein